MAAFNKDMPGVDWHQVYGDLKENQLQLMVGMLPLSLVAARFASLRDLKAGQEAALNPDMLRAMKLGEHDVFNINKYAQQGKWELADVALQEGMTRLEGGNVQAARQKALQKYGCQEQLKQQQMQGEGAGGNEVPKQSKVNHAEAEKQTKDHCNAQTGEYTIIGDEENITTISFNAAAGEAQVMAELVFQGDTLLLKGTHIAGKGTLKEALEVAKNFGRANGAKYVIVEGGKRTTGANPGHVPRTIKLDTGL